MTNYFKETNAEAKASFINTAVESKLTLDTKETPNFTLYTATRDNGADKLYLSQSGLHVIEGLPCSALQVAAMDEGFQDNKDWNFGFMYLAPKDERVTRTLPGNVDGNRAFHPEATHCVENAAYEALNSIMNPEHSHSIKDKVKFVATFVQYIRAGRMGELVNAIAGGQSSNPKGVFYAGREEPAEIKLLKDKYNELMQDKEQRIVFHDLHTGFHVDQGDGTPLYITSKAEDSAEGIILKSIVRDAVQGDPERAGFNFSSLVNKNGEIYNPNGSIDCHLTKEHPNATLVVTEYGTFPGSQKTKPLVNVRLALRLIAKNQLERYGGTSTRSHNQIERAFREMFYPTTSKNATQWREGALDNHLHNLEQMLRKF